MTTYARAQHSRGHKAHYGFPAGPDSFSSPAPRTTSQAPTPGPEQLHLGICAKEYARPRLQAPLSPSPDNHIQTGKCPALLDSSMSMTRIDCFLFIALTQALMTSPLNYSTPLLAAFPCLSNPCCPVMPADCFNGCISLLRARLV